MAWQRTETPLAAVSKPEVVLSPSVNFPSADKVVALLQILIEFSVTAPFTLIRFISQPQLSINQILMEEWVRQIQAWLQAGIKIYFFVHCPLEYMSPHNARYFQQLLEESGNNIILIPLRRFK
ncbi:hypothetical protein NIES806_13850 [Dolichospermum compactum NIES-806]|uniref:Uncharacterized protein n=2 Tax=Dolichospermum compactum TaxID=136073 RepID=A0A1Z4V1K8_9CYAN|nr:hypothetical protein NIES806_13850 [Dolichospermum compactum NIES-806]